MLTALRSLVEWTLIGNSVPALARFGRRVPRSLIRGLQAESFRRVVRYAARHQALFRRKLRERGIDPLRVRGPEDLGDLFTTPEDLLNLPPEEFLCGRPQAVFETTGTSGEPKRVYFSYSELDSAARYEAAALYQNGLRPEDRVICAFDAGYWVSSWVTFFACQRLSAFCSAVGKPRPQDVYERLKKYGYNVIFADPTWLVSLSEIAERDGTPPVKLIFAAGDRMTGVYRNYVQDVWKAPVILGYGSTEAGGGAGMECVCREGYHLDEFNFLFELIGRDSEGFGELAVTTLARRTMPLIRYRTRDVTRFLDSPCPCGVTLSRISRIRGRRDEMVVMGAGNLHPEIFEKVLHDVKGISDAWQVAVRQEGVHDILEFRLELTDGVNASTVEGEVRERLESRYPDVWANQRCGMYRLAFRFYPPGALEQGCKPKRLVDERTDAL